jgi:hypothetical protein
VYKRNSQVGRVAQAVEQRPFKPLVAGSIPATLTIASSMISYIERQVDLLLCPDEYGKNGPFTDTC